MSYTMCSHDKGSRSGSKVVVGSSSSHKSGLASTPKPSGGTKVSGK
jgi:hypothetical protein